jgi:RNA polymerase-interacting CarD/CdnL/TRCF family regulator
MSGEENRVTLTSGNKVIYPYQGPCLIGPVIKKVIDGRQISFYQLALLDDSGGELFVPVDKVQTIGIRPLLNRSDIPKLLDLLAEKRIILNWKRPRHLAVIRTKHDALGRIDVKKKRRQGQV